MAKAISFGLFEVWKSFDFWIEQVSARLGLPEGESLIDGSSKTPGYLLRWPGESFLSF